MEQPNLSSKDFEIVFNQSGIGVAVVSLECDVISANEAFCKIFGYNQDEIKKLNIKDITCPGDFHQCCQNTQKMLSGELRFLIEERRYRNKKKDIIWVSSIITLVRDKENNPLYFILQFYENPGGIKKSDNMVNGGYVCLWDWDFFEETLYFSPRVKDILGLSHDEELNLSTYRSLIHPDDLEIRDKAFEKHLHERKPFDIEFRIKHRDGNYIYVHSKGHATWAEDGTPIKMSGFFDDITARKEAELSLRKSEALFSQAISHSNLAVLHWNLETQEMFCDPRFYEILGLDKDFIFTPKGYESLVHPDDRVERKKALELIKQDMAPYNVEYRMKHSSGRYVWIHVRGDVDFDKSGSPMSMTGTADDITDRKESESKLSEYNKELERINEDLNSFAHIASHDLKEPIRGIYNNILFITQDNNNLDQNIKHRLDRISELCASMDNLTHSLLDYAKLQNRELVIKRVDLNKVIQEIQKTIEISSSSDNVEFKLSGKLPSVICDAVTVSQLYTNLINNAIKYNDSKKKIIEIGCAPIIGEDDITRNAFYIKDNGVGIKEKYQKDIFHPFKRLDNAEEFIQGSGMGLSFVQRIIERHNGEIWVESKEGEGSTFFFTLN